MAMELETQRTNTDVRVLQGALGHSITPGEEKRTVPSLDGRNRSLRYVRHTETPAAFGSQLRS